MLNNIEQNDTRVTVDEGIYQLAKQVGFQTISRFIVLTKYF